MRAVVVAISLDTSANISFFLDDSRNINHPDTIYATRNAIVRTFVTGDYYIGVSGNVDIYQIQVLGDGVERRPIDDKYFIITKGTTNLTVRG